MKLLYRAARRFVSLNSPFFRWFYGLLCAIRFTARLKRQGRVYRIPVRSGVGFQNLIGWYETWFPELIVRLELPQGSTVIDVGANTGQSLLSLLAVRPDLRVVTVDPNPHCVKYLRDLVKANDLDGVSVVEAALHDTPGFLQLQTRYRDDLLATTTDGFRKFTNYSQTLRVEATTGDLLCRRLDTGKPSLIKVDVEGGEASVLRGFQSTLSSARPLVLCEILPVQTEAEEVTAFRTREALNIFALVAELRYAVFNIGKMSEVSSPEELSAKLRNRDYLLVPSERRLEVLRSLGWADPVDRITPRDAVR